MKNLITRLLFLLIIGVCAVFGIDEFVRYQADPFIYSDILEVPKHKVGLVLGTSRFTINGEHNPFFINRIDAAVELYMAKKIDFIVVSGDNQTMSYNEPKQMKAALIAKGVDPERIILDYAGFRTLDSVIRCKKVFGQDSFIVISQKFHNERAIFIARKRQIDAVAFNAAAVPLRLSMTTLLREKLARVKTILDLYVLQTQPKFLGDKVEIPTAL